MARLSDRLLATVLILAGCATALGQNPLPQTPVPVNRDSHILLPGTGFEDRRWAEQQLQARLRQARDLREAMDVLEQLLKNDELKKIDPETLKRLGARMQGKDGERRIDPNDPEVKKLVGQLRDRLAAQGKDLKPEQLEKLKKVIGELPGGKQQAQNPNDPRDPKDPMGDPMNPRDPPRPPVDPMPPRPPDQANPPPPQNPAPPVEEPKKEESPKPRRNRRWLDEQLESLKTATGIDKPMNRLFGPEGLFRNLTGDLSSRTRSLSSQLLPRNLRLDRLFSGSGEGSGSSGGLTSSLPNLSLTPNFSSSSAEGGGSGTGSMIGGALVLVLLLGAGGLIFWLIFQGGKRLVQVGDQEWKPGPWPVAPTGIRTASDLIRAFEHLAFVVVGYQARSRHHRALAELIGGEEPTDRRFAAEDLAQLYELARYAPPQDELTESDVERARRDLMLLTGEPTA